VETVTPTPEEVRQMPLGRRTHWLRRHFDFRPRKSLGQNFLVDVGAAQQIVQAAEQFGPQRIVEVGPGLGALTMLLAAWPWDIIAIETDRQLCNILDWLLNDVERVQILQGDFLEADLAEVAGEDAVVVGNLPYYITSPILEKVFQTRPRFAAMVITLQQEVGQRLQAKPGTKQYGSLTVFCRYYAAEIETLVTLLPKAFWPPPKVSSQVLRLTLRGAIPEGVENENAFFTTVRSAFGYRRKTLRNSLKTSQRLDLPVEQIDAALAETGIDGSRRGETLDFDEFVALGNAVYHLTEAT